MKACLIETENLCKQYGSHSSKAAVPYSPAVRQVNLHVRPGRIYGLLGRNGAGKSTTMKMLLGLVTPTEGQIRIFGENFTERSAHILPRIGSLIETPGFYMHLSAAENLEIFARLRGTVRVDAVQRALDVVNLSWKDKKPIGRFSLGMKQRLGIANAIMNDPELLILDEPTNGLDPVGIAEMRSFIQDLCHAQRKTILISSHILSEMALIAEDIGILHEGRLLVEKSLSQLQKENGKYLLLKVSSPEAACRILENQLGITDFRVEPEGMLRLYDLSNPPERISQVLITNNVLISQMNSCSDSLEDYFKRITGGAGIA